MKAKYIIGIGGVSNSGKSRIARKIRGFFKDESVRILHQDNYVREEAEIPKIDGKTDWECPESMDFNGFIKAIEEAAREHDVVIAEGLMVFYDDMINRLFNRRIFAEIPRIVFFKRKEKDLRWGKEPAWYMEHIWESYLKYGLQNLDRYPLLRVRGDRPLDEQALHAFIFSD